jgi:hypothetical protein
VKPHTASAPCESCHPSCENAQGHHLHTILNAAQVQPDIDMHTVQAQTSGAASSVTTQTRPSRPVSDFHKYKIELCRHWESTGQCPFGNTCLYAHGPDELRTESQNETLKSANDVLDMSQPLIPRRRHVKRCKQPNITIDNAE